MMLKVRLSFQLKSLFHVEIVHLDLCDDWQRDTKIWKLLIVKIIILLKLKLSAAETMTFSFYINCLILLTLEHVPERTFVDK